ncbi:MAG TPA: hypothetical protein VH092_27830 [Urbifossiella sp.]|jgi:hypothetical protein|nr:hypothetical protein [Urbifossiella sp.]
MSSTFPFRASALSVVLRLFRNYFFPNRNMSRKVAVLGSRWIDATNRALVRATLANTAATLLHQRYLSSASTAPIATSEASVRVE